jgi:AraC-like DNA-binding protein
MPATSFRPLPPKLEALAAGEAFPRHRHRNGYVSIILSGGFEEAGDNGRRRVGPGDALLHGPFNAHAERAMRATRILNLALPPGRIPEIRHGAIDDPDAIVRTCAHDPAAALGLLLAQLRPVEPQPQEWPDQLAQAIRTGGARSLRLWAEENGLHPAGLARGFGQLYGVSPARYRADQRTWRAWGRIVAGAEALSAIAYGVGFADQAHMCRSIRAMTGRSPAGWRRLNKFKI